MAEERTPEQKAADLALIEAVESAVRAYGLQSEKAMIIDWVVIGRGVSYDDISRGVSHSWSLLPNGDLDITVILGLINRARLDFERDYMEGSHDHGFE